MTVPVATAVSAPGKVLVAGGYLVLDRERRCLVVATTSRFYAAALPATGRNPRARPRITVAAPQFLDGRWEYEVVPLRECWDLASPANQTANPYIEAVLKVVFALAGAQSGRFQNAGFPEWWGSSGSWLVLVVADNDFYSQRESLERLGMPATYSSLRKLPKFSPCGCRIADVHKTGLGSSAALTTALAGCLLAHFGVIPPRALEEESESGRDARRLLYAVAQLAHCFAQGKLGSGFDVAAGVFGSMLYRRFSPSVLEPLLALVEEGVDAISRAASPLLAATLDSEHCAFRLPPLVSLALADVNGGSQTPGMVRSVLKWRKGGGDSAADIWSRLGAANERSWEALLRMSSVAEEDFGAYRSVVEACSACPAAQWGSLDSDLRCLAAHGALRDAADSFEAIRCLIREMSTASGVPIEPDSQSALLDLCMMVPGVIAAGVPGAGGYDAIFCLHLDFPSVRSSLERAWAPFRTSRVLPLLAGEGMSGIAHHPRDGGELWRDLERVLDGVNV